MSAPRGPVELWDPTIAVLEAASTSGGCPLTTGLEQLCELVGAHRGDGGYVRSLDSVYRPTALVARPGQETADFALPVDDELMSSIFTSDGAVVVGDFSADVPGGRCRTTMLDIGTRAVIARRLNVDSRVFGLVCLDWVGDAHTVDEQLVELVDLFVSSVLAPVLIAASSGSPDVDTVRLLDLLSGAEVAAVRLAASGLSYREIAAQLGKSVNTIDHQLLNARRRVGARNTSQLVQMLGPEFEDRPTSHQL